MQRQGILFFLIGPAGSGKSTLCKRLLDEFSDRLRYSVSATTRSPRPGESDGVSYRFMSRDEFCKLRDAGEFFEWEENHGNLYGTLKATLITGINQGNDLLYQIDIRGALNFKRAFPSNVVITFIVPPNFNELRKRLLQRGVDTKDLETRLATARTEYEGLLDSKNGPLSIDYVVMNNDIDVAYSEVRAILIAERARSHRLDDISLREICGVGNS